MKICLVIDHTKSVLQSGEGQQINFRNFKRLARAPLITYGTFKCVLIPLTDNVQFGPKLKNITIIFFAVMDTN